MAEENEEGLDWLFPNKERDEAALKEKGLVFAQKYLLFAGPTADRRAVDLLKFWTETVRRKRVPAGATAQEYAAHNAVREFVEAIHAQIEFANQGLNQPKPRTSP